MKRSTLILFLSTVCTCTILFISCNTVDLINFSKDIKIDESLVVPIGQSSLTLKDVFTRFGVPSNMDTVNHEINFHWTFSNELMLNSLNLADSIYPFNQIIYPSPFPLTYPANMIITLPSYDGSFDLAVNKTGSTDRVDSIYVNSSLINVSVDVSPDLLSQIQAKDMRVEFVFPDNKLHIDSGINPSFTPAGYGQTGQLAIGKYSMKLIGSSIIPFKINIYIKEQNKPININPTTMVKIHMDFTKIDFSVAYGFFNLEYNESKNLAMPIRIEDYLPDANLRFSNPNMELSATTNVGADLDIKVDYLKAYYSTNPSNFMYAWFNNHTTNAITQSIVGPLFLGDSTITKFNAFDNKNGEIDHFFDNKPYPDMIGYKFSVINNSLRKSNFVTPSSSIKLNVTTVIPLKLKNGSNYSLTDTIHNLALGTLVDDIDSAILVLTLKNGLPMKARCRMTLLKSTLPNDTISSQGEPISIIKDTSTPGNLFSTYEINCPKVDSVGTVTGITPQSINIVLNKNQILQLKQTKSIIYSLAFEGGVTNEKPNALHFTTINSFGVNLGIFVRGNKVINIGNANN